MEIDIALTEFDQLDQFALLACQDYNLGNNSNWFLSFRGGLYGFYSRVYGVIEHFRQVHAWIPRLRLPYETEYHLATAFFHMDSTIECLTFAFNALGYAYSPNNFRDVTTERGLKSIQPRDITGSLPADIGTVTPRLGYALIYPTLQQHWIEHTSLIQEIVDQHDVSKHRQAIFTGGLARSDAPQDFFKIHGIPNDPLYSPMKEIILGRHLRKPQKERDRLDKKPRILFEDLAVQYVNFIEKTGLLVFSDAKRNIHLKRTHLKP